jgi:curved DNA-binding protein
MDYYNILGLKKEATPEEIKKAYRSMAMRHHPDRGGDEKKFKEISQAYEFLIDPEKKRMIDAGIDPNNINQQQSGFYQESPFEFHFNSNNFQDIFENFGFNFGHRQPRKNKNIAIKIEISLEEVLTGKELNFEINTMGGNNKTISINIPPGVESGQQIQYHGMGDDTIPNIPPGDLIVNIIVKKHSIFERSDNSIICEKSISVWDAILGTSTEIVGINGKSFSVSVPPGTQPNTVLSCKGEGLPRLKSNIRGDLLIKIKVEIPKQLDSEYREFIKKIRDGI